MGSRICGHDWDTSPINNHQRDLYAHDGSHIFNEYLYRFEPRCRGLKQSCILFPLSHDILLARYLIIGITIPSSISSLASNLYSFRNTTFHLTNSLVTCLQAMARSISFRHANGQIPVLMHATQQVLFEIPERHLYNHPVTKWWLMSPKYSYGTRE